jgi:hypothetical protein
VEETEEQTIGSIIDVSVSPNPFRDATKIRYEIRDAGYEIDDMTLEIYDAAGRLVKDFRITPDALRSTLSWDGRDDYNRILGSGVYFLRFSFAQEERSIPIVLLQ